METNQQYEIEYLDYKPPAWSKRKHKTNKNGSQKQSQARNIPEQNDKMMIKARNLEIEQKINKSENDQSKRFEIRQGQTFEQIVKQMEQEQRMIKTQLKKKKEVIQYNQSKIQIQLTQSHLKKPTNEYDVHVLDVQKRNKALNSQQIRQNQSQNKQTQKADNDKRWLATSEESVQNEKEDKRNQIKIDFCNCQIILSQKKLKQFTADVLFIPFQTQQFQYYPGSELKQRLQKQRQKLSKAEMFEGSIYIKNKHEIPSIKYLVFLKVKSGNFSTAFSKGMNSLLVKAKKDKMLINSILFCLHQNQIKINEFINGMTASKQLKLYSEIKLNIAISQNMDIEAISKQIEGILLNESV